MNNIKDAYLELLDKTKEYEIKEKEYAKIDELVTELSSCWPHERHLREELYEMAKIEKKS